MDNLSQQLFERLDDYLDHKLSDEEMEAVTALLQHDPSARQALEQLKIARETISLSGLQQRIKGSHVQNRKLAADFEAKTSFGRPGVVRYLRPALQMAAAIAVLIFGAGVFQFFTYNGQAAYDDNFLSYHLSVKRNDYVTDHREIDSLYRAGQFEAVVQTYRAGDSSDNFSRFLTAMAYLESGNEQEAITLFLRIQQENSEAPSKSFEQEAAYYLALAYLKAGETDKALELINDIKKNDRHLFRNNFTEWELWKLRIIALKD